MRLLLDTHVLVWVLTDSTRVPRELRLRIADPECVRLVSCASLLEIATKVRLGKWPEAEGLEPTLSETLDAAGYTLLPIDPQVALRAGRLPGKHGDPFDRIIAAHALLEDIQVISVDARLDSFGVRRLW